MYTFLWPLIALLLSLLLSYFTIPFLKTLALKHNIVDKPKKDRFHSNPTPLLGGMGIFWSFLLSLVVIGKVSILIVFAVLIGVSVVLIGILKNSNHLPKIAIGGVIWSCIFPLFFVGDSDLRLVGMLLGGTVLLVMGSLDDTSKWILPHTKLLAQIAAAVFVIAFRIRIGFLGDPIWSIPLTLFWIIGVTNAFNLIDNMNGLSSGTAIIASLFFGSIALYKAQAFSSSIDFYNSQMIIVLLCFALTGSCLGFFLHNFPKAKIFMGDGGSHFLGFTLASVAIIASWHTVSHVTSISVPIFVLCYPIFDITLVIFARIKERRPIYVGGTDHSSHRLVKMGCSPVDAVLLLLFLSFLGGFCALFLTMVEYKQGIMMIAFMLLILVLFGIRMIKVNVGAPNIRKGRKNEGN